MAAVALDPLATVADARELGLTVADDEEPMVERYLRAASAAVRDAAGVPISQITSTVELEGRTGVWLRLPGPPITAVSQVLLDGDEVTDYRLRTTDLWRRRGWQTTCGEPSTVQVTLTHGMPAVPEDIVMLVCRIVAATLNAWRDGDGGEGLAAGAVTQERIGDYSVSYGDGGLITEMELPDYLRQRLAERFGGGAAVVGSR
ncbi:head-tail connector protein [Streptomonospora wellingtoniae]|uniref:Phage gp6-like head-tail connector protein n=1 Tax=Streptomonospora wellingtoniae TaxID=3075544 RepID=A0ABU2L156_9ACTN|nr:hypothetical protein [Streptomonospora sp. DSM 45055]MDT0305068.1 hypothetical protein [Streptomonospora sp. DSM 45055]